MIARLFVAACALLFAAGLAQADDWAGLYAAIDSGDGSLDWLSIAPDGDGTYAIKVKANDFGSCEATAPEAIMTGRGRIVDDGLAWEETMVVCSEGIEKALDDRLFTLDAATGILALTARSSNRTIYFHRISN